MTPGEYLDAAKQTMGITSDNELANRLDVARFRISAYRKGREWPDYYVITRLAIALNLDPATVLADLESQHEKNPNRQEFWRSFLSRAAKVAVVLILAWSFTAISGHGHGTPGGLEAAALYAIVLFWVTRWMRII